MSEPRCRSPVRQPADGRVAIRRRLRRVVSTAVWMAAWMATFQFAWLSAPSIRADAIRAEDSAADEPTALPPSLPLLPEDAEPVIRGIERPWAQIAMQPVAEQLPSPNLDPSQAGNIRRGAGGRFLADPGAGSSPVLDPNQPGNLDARLEATRERLEELEGRAEPLPLIRLSGFFQVDDGLFSQSAASQGYYGDIQDGVGFRRARLQAIGKIEF